MWVSVGPGGQAALPRTLARACRRLCSARAAEQPMRTGPRRGPGDPAALQRPRLACRRVRWGWSS